jgi:wyosine [tRNA(Phe)-imidazoG37] synthetase (radical SAM superfamily)
MIYIMQVAGSPSSIQIISIFAPDFHSMPTFLFDDIVFGPVNSRRLGVSLGLNLVPVNRKVCTFNCIYCECGWTRNRHLPPEGYPSRELIADCLRKKLTELKDRGQLPDALTYAGNGEPTLHPEFPEIITDTLEIRNKYAPDSRIVVLSNGSLAHRPGVKDALMQVDRNILKLDTGIEKTFRVLNQPPPGIKLANIINNLKLFEKNLILQTLFIRGSHEGMEIDNTSPEEVSTLLELYWEISPDEVQVYTIARDTPISTLSRVPLEDLESIAAEIEELGIRTSVFP